MRYAANSIAGIELPLADRTRKDVFGLAAATIGSNVLNSKMHIRCDVACSCVRRSTLNSGVCRETNWMPSRPYQIEDMLAWKYEPKFGRI